MEEESYSPDRNNTLVVSHEGFLGWSILLSILILGEEDIDWLPGNTELPQCCPLSPGALHTSVKKMCVYMYVTAKRKDFP